jgi:competence protein ComEC
MDTHRKLTLYSLLMLGFIVCVVWIALLHEDRRGVLRVSFLNVGQGDAIFIDAPSGRQVLIDGGQGTAVLRELSKVMPWYDRSLDLIIGTHGDTDHIGGLIEVLSRYRVAHALVPSTKGESDAWRTYLHALETEERSGARVMDAHRGERIDLGGGAYLDVLFPDRSLPRIETNTGCVVTRLVYGATSFMLPCDSPDEIEKYIVLLDGTNLKSTVLKAGHHGSKTSSSALFLGIVDPEYAVFSRGCDNSYGHPSKEIVERFQAFAVPTYDTCIDGTITFVSDGQTVARK